MAANMKKQVRDNTLELREFLNDLQDWERSVKEKDKKLKTQVPEEEKVNLPPVRGRVQNSCHSSVRRAQGSGQPPVLYSLGVKESEDKFHKDGCIAKSTAASHTYDYFQNKWDKFDVDAALREVDECEKPLPPRKAAVKEMKTYVKEIKASSKPLHGENQFQRNYGDGNSGTIDRLSSVLSSSDNVTDATLEKEQGNEYFMAKKYAQAIDCYSRSIVLYPTAVAFANRAMAYIKIKRFEEAEYDCTEAINLDDRYVKAYSRRGTARREIGNLVDAIEDFEFALRLEPDNKELKKLYVETRALYEKKVDEKLAEEKVPVVIQEVTSIPVENIAEKTQSKAVEGIMGKNAQGRSAATSDSTLAKDSTKMEVDPRKVGSNVKQRNLVANQNHDAQLSPQEAASRAASRAMAAAAQNITAPRSAYEFESMWKGFSGDQSAQCKLLKVMAPSSIPKVFKEALSASLLMDIIRCIELFFMENVDFALQFLEYLTRVGRFDMTIMCLSSKERAELCRIWDEVFTNERVPFHFQEALNRLRSKYCR